jgi:hypothetical protein
MGKSERVEKRSPFTQRLVQQATYARLHQKHLWNNLMRKNRKDFYFRQAITTARLLVEHVHLALEQHN